jgi:lipopolysaccharide transport system ATP-binding protein
MSTAIKVENLSKIYRLGEIGTGTISRDLERWYKTKLLGKEDPFLKIGESNDRSKKGASDIVYSLKDINFEIEQGDAVGIIGRNGAGKSTLLKILSRVTSPTTGKINIKGRVASLLEVGTGFHPELTGRENIYLNGAILGMRKKEIDRKLEEIIDFSGVERYIDTPVKRYSSGMYVRLAFAVAAHLESEILIVDEVLAVGDAEFQKKCLGKMGEVSKGEGRTVLFVSHNMSAISSLCKNGLLLNKGKISFFGTSKVAVKKYMDSTDETCHKLNWDFNLAPKQNGIKLLKAEILNFNGVFNVREEIVLKFEFFRDDNELMNIDLTFHLIDENGILVFVASSAKDLPIHFSKNGYLFFTCIIPAGLMNEGRYFISRLILIQNKGTQLFELKNTLSFDIIQKNERYGWMEEKEGAVDPILKWDLQNKNY